MTLTNLILIPLGIFILLWAIAMIYIGIKMYQLNRMIEDTKTQKK